MKKIDEFLKSLPDSVDYNVLIDRFMDSPILRKFILDHDLTRDQIIKAAHTFLTYLEEHEQCNQCEGLSKCKLNTTGFTPHLIYRNGLIKLEYEVCRFNQNIKKANISALYIPKKIFEANIEDLDLIGESRKTIHQYMMKFLKHNHRTGFMKGMYISGKYGSGKTYFMASLANELANMDYKIIFTYYPDLVREIKSSISEGDLEEKINKLKVVDFLFLDDIGGEYYSKFIRDEVLGSVLQHRLLDNKATFFTSNYTVTELANVIKDSNTQQEAVSAYRIIERIKRMTEEFVLKDMPRNT